MQCHEMYEIRKDIRVRVEFIAKGYCCLRNEKSFKAIGKDGCHEIYVAIPK